MTNGGISGTNATYAGDMTVQETWDLLASDPEAVLIDVRTTAEWAYVGLPDLSSLNKSVQPISWVQFPDMSKNENFIEEISTLQPNKAAPMIFLCRSGVRSIAAAEAATQAGYSRAYNVLEGFEGAPDQNSHRGKIGGWKAAGLNWKQS
ncbi:rhodanese-like domain-containing protein [Sneathiella litorea]|uniref:Rhodanese-like domain-containing protein n=1 Tax=Sneathiella litorea TaxID=2606216 RepID=A0A6L8W4T4_9PROT|nr:rhodanese-like domain-containing protein [Sneathiella litorea]MZR29749.1 rhodanese-like domain-containing protein [Sneathiella litorea]